MMFSTDVRAINVKSKGFLVANKCVYSLRIPQISRRVSIRMEELREYFKNQDNRCCFAKKILDYFCSFRSPPF